MLFTPVFVAMLSVVLASPINTVIDPVESDNAVLSVRSPAGPDPCIAGNPLRCTGRAGAAYADVLSGCSERKFDNLVTRFVLIHHALTNLPRCNSGNTNYSCCQRECLLLLRNFGAIFFRTKKTFSQQLSSNTSP